MSTEEKRLYMKAKKLYFGSATTIMTDVQFDLLEAKLRRLYPNWKELENTGVKVSNKKTEAPLPFFMPV